ncbi:MAG: ATP-dependent DNA ligase [Deltaproteobacteria bacterium]|nr:ATP-dependent DNA ligase [Deltaproteobacteria bacterium]
MVASTPPATAPSTLLTTLVRTSRETAAASARNDKVATLAGFLASLPAADIPTAVALLSGVPRQGRVGIGWATVAASFDGFGAAAPPTSRPEEPILTLADVDRAVTTVGQTHGPGSDAVRKAVVGDLFAAATDLEAEFLAAVLVGGLRQGALAGVIASAVAKAYGVKLRSVRRAAMLLGDLGLAARLARSEGEAGLGAVGLEVGRAVEPMLASTASDVEHALTETGMASVEWKLDGIRIQVHKRGQQVNVFTRNLNDITDRTGAVVEAVRAMEADTLVLDGEVLGSQPHFFDIMLLDGVDLLDQPLEQRAALLRHTVGSLHIPAVVTDDPVRAQAHLESALAAGHEGVVVKALDTTYEAGKRGKGWKKVKPVHTLDLVVLGAEWGHGRRKGWLSNLHLGARNTGDAELGDFVMVGKTFKGLTDEVLTWQTQQILARETRRQGITVFARPELVVEIALDSSHTSTRYPGGLALRFARVRRYRDDKGPVEADTLDAVRALMVTLPVHDLPQ